MNLWEALDAASPIRNASNRMLYKVAKAESGGRFYWAWRPAEKSGPVQVHRAKAQEPRVGGQKALPMDFPDPDTIQTVTRLDDVVEFDWRPGAGFDAAG